MLAGGFLATESCDKVQYHFRFHLQAITVGGPRSEVGPLLSDNVIVPSVVGVHSMIVGCPAITVPSIGTIGLGS
jgi:hypothetical protein